jgi:ribosomal-protein-alanine N-acetyltransferase
MIRPMRFDDIDVVYNMERRLFPNPWPKVFFERDLESPETVALIAEYEGRVVGYAISRCVDVKFHITNIAVDEKYQRRGIATRLMINLERIASERGCNYAYLEVRTNNNPAVNFYKKIDYDISHIHKQYYIYGDDAFVMHKKLR